MQDLDSLLEKKQAAKKSKKCLTASQHKFPVNTETSPGRKQLTSPKGGKKSVILKEKHGQEPRKFPAARGLLIGLYFIFKYTLSVNLPSGVQFCSMLHTAGQTCITAHM